MKKLIFLIVTLFIFLFVAELSSCFIEDDDGRYPEPSVTSTSDTAISIACNSYKGMKYITVFRRSSTDPQMSDADTQLIAQIDFPDKQVNGVVFLDESVENKYYTYFLRYSNGSYYTYTKETEVQNNPNWTGSELEAKPTGVGNPELLYLADKRSKNHTLELKYEFGVPAKEYDLYMIVNNGKSNRPFKMYGSDGDNLYAPNVPVDLLRLLTPDCFDVDIKISGIIGVKNEKATNGVITHRWTNLCETDLFRTLFEEDNDTMTPDESDTAVADKTIRLPIPYETDNKLDYSPSSRAAFATREYGLDFNNPFN